MKQLFCLVLAALMLLVLFTGCAKEQHEEPLPGLTLATGTEWTAQPQAQKTYEVPDRFTGEWTGLEDTFTVKADAEIILPEDIGKLCTAKVKRHAFTQEEADKVLEVFLKGNTLYENIYLTYEACREAIDDFEACLRGEKEYTGDGTLERLPEVIAWWKEQMKTAPHEGEIIPAKTTFQPDDMGGESIEGYAEVDGRTLHVSLRNSGEDHYWADEVQVWEEGYGRTGGSALITHESIDAIGNFETVPAAGFEREIAVGDKLMEELGLEMFTCDGVIPVQYAEEVVIDNCYEPVATGEEGVLLEYVRKVNGLPLTKTNFDGSASEAGMSDIGWWHYEAIQVYVLGDRVVCFDWENPYEVTDIQSAGTLMDFAEIQDVFAQMIFVKNNYWLGINKANGFDYFHDYKIDKVQMTLMRVRPKDSVTEGTIIPVWDFWGTDLWTMPDYSDDAVEEYGVLLTLNALDGTLVDREIGY